MTLLMCKRDVLLLAQILVRMNPEFESNPYYYKHLIVTGDEAGRVVREAHSHYPKLKEYLDEKEIALAGYLHDIGRPLSLDTKQLFHEIVGARFIEERGLKLGVSDNLIDVYRIAQMFRPHGLVYERYKDPLNAEARDEFEIADAEAFLLPSSWQEAIVVYADARNANGKLVSFEKRIADLKKRYSCEEHPTFRAMKIGKKRVSEICENVEKLRDGKLSEEELGMYVFL